MADFEDLDIYMSGPYIDGDDVEFVKDAVLNGWYGSKAYWYVENFENNFANYHDRKFALMTTNCTSAIHLILQALNISEEDEVLVPDITWIGSAAPIIYQNAKPIFVDVNRNSWCIEPEDILRKITSKTKALISVNVYGNMADYEKIEKICQENNIVLIEDAAESLGSMYKQKKSGSFGTASVFSFHRTKTLTTGEGGMLLLDDEKLYERSKFLRDHGRFPGSFFNMEVTYKYMPSNLAASLGYSQLQKIDKLIAKKRYILNFYRQNIKNHGEFSLNPEPENHVNGAWCSALVFSEHNDLNGKDLMDFMSSNKIPTRPFFYPLTKLPAFANLFDLQKIDNPVAEILSYKGCCLPSAMNMDDTQLQNVANVVNSFLKLKA